MNKRIHKDSIGYYFSWFSISIAIIASLGITLFLIINGIRQINPHFLFSEPVPTMVEKNSGGISTPIIGTCILTVLGMLFAFPWSLATAIFLAEYSKRFKLTEIFRSGIDILAGVPTIVIAIFGLAIFTQPQFAFLSQMLLGTNKAYGRSFLVAALTMAVMVLPFLIKTCEEALKSVPESYREASFAMGASRWQTITKVVIPAAKNGIITAITLGMGRIIGDTVIVWLTLGGSIRMTGTGHYPWWSPSNLISILTNTGSTLTSYIFYTSPAGEGNLVSKAFGASLVVIMIIIIINLVVDFIGDWKGKVSEEI